jgi:hypothetical protein
MILQLSDADRQALAAELLTELLPLVLEAVKAETDDDWLTTEQAAAAWGKTRDAVRKLAQRKTVESRKVGRTLFVRPSSSGGWTV